MSEWRKCPDSDVLARRLSWGIITTLGSIDNPPQPIPTNCQHDYTVAELEWLLALAKETPNA